MRAVPFADDVVTVIYVERERAAARKRRAGTVTFLFTDIERSIDSVLAHGILVAVGCVLTPAHAAATPAAARIAKNGSAGTRYRGSP